jgi:hypothetical protein
LSGLIDVDELERRYDDNTSGQTSCRSVTGRRQVGAVSGDGRCLPHGRQANGHKHHDMVEPDPATESTVPARRSSSSYRSDASPLVAKSADG